MYSEEEIRNAIDLVLPGQAYLASSECDRLCLEIMKELENPTEIED